MNRKYLPLQKTPLLQFVRNCSESKFPAYVSLSTLTIECSVLLNIWLICDPINPAPPVIKIFLFPPLLAVIFI